MFDSFTDFIMKFLKFALLVFTGAFIVVGILWIFLTIFEWIYIGMSYLKDMVEENHDCTTNYSLITNGSTKCPNCHLLTPCGPRCSTCGTKLPSNQKIVKRGTGKATKKDDLDSTDISVVQYSERKKYQKIRCPYCNTLSKVIEEKYHGYQTRECRNGHIFVYDYESELLVQNELNAKYQ